MTPRRSIVIPTYNAAALVRRCVDLLFDQELGDTEIVVVDDGSVDATGALLEGLGDRLVAVTQAENHGFASACNAGAAAASGELLVFLNNDTLPTPGWLDALVDEADAHPEAAVIGAKLLWPDNVVQHAGVVITQGGLPHHIYSGFPAEHPAVNVSRPFQAVTAACMLVRREAFEHVGGFDEAYRNGYEDIDLCLRLGAAGHEIRYCHEAVVYHLESATRGYDEASDHANLDLLRERWGTRIAPDDVAYYVADGLLELHYTGGRHPLGIRVDQLLASVIADGADNTLPWLLNTRTEQVFALVQAAGREAPELPPTRAIAFRSDGQRVEDAPLPEDQISAEALRAVDFLASKIEPARLAIASTEPERLNVLIPSLDTGHFFGGYITVIHLLRRLRERYRLRIVAVDDPLADGAELARRRIESFQGLAGTLSGIEITTVADRRVPLPVNPLDRFVAMTSFTAHLAHAATQELGQPRFLNIIQEQDGLTFPNGSFQAVAEESYTFPQVAIFSSELLREQFARERRSVYAAGPRAGERDSLSFQNAITDVGDVTAEELSRREGHRLMFYARPQPTEARNLFELGVLALRTAIEQEVFPIGWEYTGIGRGGSDRGAIPLHGDAWLEMIPRQPLGRYRGLLRAHDLGVALMHTAHPSLVPLEMASAGMPVVTTTYGNKTAAALRALSPNIIGVEPTVPGIVGGIREALSRLEGYEDRATGAKVAWSRRWEDTFSPDTMASIERLLDRCAHGA